MNRAERRRLEKQARKKPQRNGAGPATAENQKDLETAVSHHNRGELVDAERIYQKILAQDPTQPEALYLMGVSAHQKNQNNLAKSYIQKALQHRPDYTEAVFSLGNVAQALGNNEEAVQLYRRAIKQQPNHAASYNNLATTLDKLGRSEEAVECLQTAIASDPAQVDSYRNLGLLLTKQNNLEAALPYFEKACELQPNKPVHQFDLGNHLHAMDRMEQALPHFEKLAALEPNNAVASYRMGILYEKIHDLDRAEQNGRKAIALAPEDPIAAYPLAVVLRRRGRIEEALSLLEPSGAQALNHPMESSVHFELGTLYDRSNDSRRAYRHFLKCNELEAARSLASKDGFLEKLERMHGAFADGKGNWPVLPAPGSVKSPVFIVGFPRSGTTLLDQILDAHPDLQVMEEKPAINAVIRALPGTYPNGLKELPEDEVSRLRQVYFQFVAQSMNRTEETLLIDKLPLNIVDIPLITRLFPDAKIILAMRHPCDVILSNFMQLFILNSAMANFLTLPDTTHCYSRVMGLWQIYAETLPLNWHLVRYEALIEDLEGEARNLLAFLDVPWDNAVLDPASHAKSRGRIHTPSYQSVTEPIYTRAKNRWQRYQEQMAPVLEEVRPFVEAYGYSL